MHEFNDKVTLEHTIHPNLCFRQRTQNQIVVNKYQNTVIKTKLIQSNKFI